MLSSSTQVGNIISFSFHINAFVSGMRSQLDSWYLPERTKRKYLSLRVTLRGQCGATCDFSLQHCIKNCTVNCCFLYTFREKG